MNSIVPSYEPSGYDALRCSVRAWSSGGGERALSLTFSRLIGGEVELRFIEHFARHYLALHSAVVRTDLVRHLATHFS